MALRTTPNVVDVGAGATTIQIARLIVTYQIDPHLQIAPRIGYEKERFSAAQLPAMWSTGSADSGIRATARRSEGFGSIDSSALHTS